MTDHLSKPVWFALLQETWLQFHLQAISHNRLPTATQQFILAPPGFELFFDLCRVLVLH
jgi:hypothetical protein